MASGDYSFLLKEPLPWNKLNGANILVTGANGLIASNLVEALLQVANQLGLDCRVYALTRNSEKARIRFSRYANDPCLRIIEADVSEDFDSLVNYQYIIHAASSACPEAFNRHPVDVMKSNFIGTLRLLDKFCKNSSARFLFVSSSEVYGENEEGKEFFTEDDFGSVNFARFRACYPESKRASETLCMSYKQQYSSDVVIVRPSFIFGKEIADSNTRADVYFLRQALNGEAIVMNSRGTQLRSYLYVKDCVNGMMYALLKGDSGDVFNIGDPECIVALCDYARQIANAGGVELRFDLEQDSKDMVFLKTGKCVLDSTKLQQLGWRCHYSLQAGIADLFE